MIKYSKLVRDFIPDIISRDGCIAITHIADAVEFPLKLLEKLSEEVDELTREKNEGEFADVYEVIDAIIKHWQLDRAQITAFRMGRSKEVWDFEKLHEEVRKFRSAQSEEILAAIYEALHTLAQQLEFRWDDIEETRINKRKEKGGFDRRIILDEMREK